MKRNYRKEYISAKAQAVEMARMYTTSNGICLYLSFTRYGKNVFKRLNSKLYEDAMLDYELGVICESERKTLLDAYNIIENSIAEGLVY